MNRLASAPTADPGEAPLGDPEIEAAEAELASRLRLAVTRLHRRLRQQAVGGLSPAQTSALASTDRLGAPTLGELAALESVQPPSMTRIIAALEELGLVARVVDPTDRRVVRVQVSDAGRQVLVESRSRKNVYLARQLHRLTPDEREGLGGLTAVLERLAEGLEP
ncbi:MAG TPA: MarR family transcriptional regulator [Acidimicrobiales bacterium]|nr:MarR family transcriptional regulator [Acidimicrobiales bacterium]